MKLYIKDMVCLLGEAQVKEELKKLKISYVIVDDGMVDLPHDLGDLLRGKLSKSLLSYGLKLHDEKKTLLIEKIKTTIKEMIRYTDGLPVMCYSAYISMNLHYDYTYLSNVFSEVCSTSIQQFIILSKIERVKEFFLTSDISLSEISFLLHYSSVAHLSSQFKKITGLSPSCYKAMMHQNENILNI
ncbi:helix-turn-helix domain-containing protein [Psychroflexus salinarum]|uniref:Helix-turn-helix domain-containing protein n=1 Tax=Psychroflexus salinarum TaxID=546024 RepID=A0ABW3GKJ0_9FLAO